MPSLEVRFLIFLVIVMVMLMVFSPEIVMRNVDMQTIRLQSHTHHLRDTVFNGQPDLKY